jgi:hypothetical protein
LGASIQITQVSGVMWDSEEGKAVVSERQRRWRPIAPGLERETALFGSSSSPDGVDTAAGRVEVGCWSSMGAEEKEGERN